MELPAFKYHPDPIGTGSIIVSDHRCEVCRQTRGYIYTSSIYSVRELESVCPWCIHDGTAHIMFSAEFTDTAGVGGYGEWERVPPEVVQAVAFRTPGFAGWQSQRWFTHCGDAAAFLGPMGREELTRLGEEAIDAIYKESGLSGDEWAGYFEGMDRHSGPTAYLFRCLHCGRLGGYSDAH